MTRPPFAPLHLALLVALPAAALAAPELPAAPDELVFARAFVLEEGVETPLAPGEGPLREGYVIVLRADPELGRARAVGAPVLVAGRRAVGRLNHGSLSDVVVGAFFSDAPLNDVRIWFAAHPEPGVSGAEAVRRAVAEADAAGLRPFPPGAVRRALQRGGEPLVVPSYRELQPYLSQVVEAHDPSYAEARRPGRGPRP